MKGIGHKHRDLAKAYSREIKSLGIRARFLTTTDVLSRIIYSEAPRFYISYEVAYAFMLPYYSEKSKERKLPKRRGRMYEDLRKSVFKYIEQGYTFPDAITKAIESPAPSYYISMRRAQNIISYIRKEMPWMLM